MTEDGILLNKFKKHGVVVVTSWEDRRRAKMVKRTRYREPSVGLQENQVIASRG